MMGEIADGALFIAGDTSVAKLLRLQSQHSLGCRTFHRKQGEEATMDGAGGLAG